MFCITKLLQSMHYQQHTTYESLYIWHER